MQQTAPLQAKARPAANSVRRARDTTARRDTLRARGAPPHPPAPPPPPPPPPLRPAVRDTSAARVDTTKIRQILKQRHVPSDRLFDHAATPPQPCKKYPIRVRDAANLSDADAAEAHGVLTVPAP